MSFLSEQSSNVLENIVLMVMRMHSVQKKPV